MGSLTQRLNINPLSASVSLSVGFYMRATLTLNELSVGDLVKGGSEIYSKLTKNKSF